MSTAMDNAGHDCSVLTEAESLIMAKGRLIDEYGTLRYTIGTGCSGGSLAQQQVANAYPGVYQGILPAVLVPGLLVDRAAARRLPAHPQLLRGPGRGARGSLDAGADRRRPGSSKLRQLRGAEHAVLADAGGPGYACAGVPRAALEPDQPDRHPVRPRGLHDQPVRALQGRQPLRLRRHSARQRRRAVRPDPLEQGIITPEQFVDLNQKIGGYDHNFDTPRRGRSPTSRR